MQSGSSGLEASGKTIDEGESAHEILGLRRNASSAEVRAAYIKLVKEYHPDTHPGNLAAERFKRITKAYNELRSPYHVLGGARFFPPEFWGSYGRVLAVTVLFLVLAPLAIFLVMTGGERPGPSLELRQAERAASPGSGDAGGTTPVKEATIERSAAPSERTPEGGDGISVAALSERFAIPPERARAPGPQAPSPHDEIAVAPANDMVQPKDQNDQKKVASVQPGMQDKREPAVEEASRTSKKANAVPRKMARSALPSQGPAAPAARNAPVSAGTGGHAEAYSGSGRVADILAGGI